MPDQIQTDFLVTFLEEMIEANKPALGALELDAESQAYYQGKIVAYTTISEYLQGRTQ